MIAAKESTSFIMYQKWSLGIHDFFPKNEID
jgi:hypothetical protein